MADGFEGFEPIFGKSNAEWDSSSSSLSSSSPPFFSFLFHVHALDAYCLRIHATDFHSYTWEATRSIQQLQDMRDNIGVGGSWLEFVDYLIESLKSENVKLVLGGAKSKSSSGDPGAMSARLIAHKSKGMPRISISLHRLLESSASDAMAKLSLGLYKALKSKNHLPIKEDQARWHQLTKDSSAEQDKHVSAQSQLDTVSLRNRQNLQNHSTSHKTLSVADNTNSNINTVNKHDSPRKTSSGKDPRTTKIGKRAAPAAYRRSKVRGAVLGDAEDEDEDEDDNSKACFHECCLGILFDLFVS